MVINGTSKIKGVIDLPSIKQQLKKGQVLHIKNNDYWNNDVQMAIKMGFVTSTEIPDEMEEETNEGETPVRCVNNFNRPIGLKQSKMEIKPGQEFTVTQKDLEEPSMRAALSKGIISIVSGGDAQETTVNITKNLSDSEPEITEDELGPSVDTNEEIILPSKIVDSKPIQDQKKVIWNAKPQSKSPEQTVVPENDPKQHTIVGSRNGPKEVTMKKHLDMEDLSFVDKNEDAERIKKHPVLKNKPLPQNEEINPIAEDPTETRRKKHPVLGKKDNKEEDQSFIDL